MNDYQPVLFSNKTECCACGACISICPKNAISFSEDSFGFLYPEINRNLCIKCGACVSICAFKDKKVQNSPIEVYAAVAKAREIVEESSSGGVFAVIAKAVLAHGGVVVGAAFQDDYEVKHIAISSEDELKKLQGSKYTQSNVNNIYTMVESYLKKDKEVLFSGTPCQVDGLKSYLQKEYKKLITVDIICHGVPSNKMFQEYIRNIEEKEHSKINCFKFRDKTFGWGINASAVIHGKKKRIWQNMSSYLYYFAKGWIYRDSCYQCKYTNSHRTGDITLGDFWGIEKQHPEYLGKKGWDETKGISVVIVNTSNGERIIKQVLDDLDLRVSTFEKAAVSNEQLRHPIKSGKRAEILNVYRSGGWYNVEQYFRKQIGWRYYMDPLKNMIPKTLKRKLKSLKSGSIKLKKFARYFKGGDWIVLYRKKNSEEFLRLKGKKNYWYADPFLFEYDGEIFLFTEAFCIKSQIGKIAVSKMYDGIFSAPEVIIENAYHMSYPCVFSTNNKVYMIPETGEGKRLDLYEFTEFPYKVKKTTLVVGVEWADCTVCFFREEPFLVAYDERDNRSMLYRIDLEKGKLSFVSDRKHEEKHFRPAGNMFEHGGKLYRPTQNCEKTYGGSLRFNEVLDFLSLNEIGIKEMYPEDIDTRYSKLHTYNETDGYEVIDVFLKKRGIRCFIGNVKRKLHRMKMRI